MKAELTAENRPACVPPASVCSAHSRKKTTDENKGCVQVFVVLFRVVAIKLSGFSAVHSEEVRPGVIGPQRLEILSESRMEAGSGCQQPDVAVAVTEWTGRTTLDLSERPSALVVEDQTGWAPGGRGIPSVVSVERRWRTIGRLTS